MSKNLRYDVCEMKLNEFVEEVRFKKPQAVWIVDRENAGLIEKPVRWKSNSMWV